MAEWLKAGGQPCKEGDDPSALYMRISNCQVTISRDTLGWSVVCNSLGVKRRLHTRDLAEAKVSSIRELIVDAQSQARRCSELASALQDWIDKLPANRV